MGVSVSKRRLQTRSRRFVYSLLRRLTPSRPRPNLDATECAHRGRDGARFFPADRTAFHVLSTLIEWLCVIELAGDETVIGREPYMSVHAADC